MYSLCHLLVYVLQVGYQYTTCSGADTGSMSLSGANGSIFTITGLESYTRWVLAITVLWSAI